MSPAELATAAREREAYLRGLVSRQVRFSSHGLAVIGLLDDAFGLGGRLHFGDLSKVRWEHASFIELKFTGQLATFDTDTLTQLVVRCHDAGIRLQVEALRPRTFRLTFSQRGRSGTRYERHPDLETAIQAVRSRTYFGRPEAARRVMNRTSIEWTDFSANPLKFHDQAGKVVWGCVHASPGCQHCYAETLAKRYGRGGPFSVPTMNGLTPFLDEKELRRMLTYKPASGKRCFVGDMTDVFGPWVPDELLDRLFAVFALRNDVTWQVLTKRADRMRAYLSASDVRDRVTRIAAAVCGDPAPEMVVRFWPLLHVWLGVSCEDQARADERVYDLIGTPAAVRFVSAEPLLGPIDFRDIRPMRNKRTVVQPLIHWPELDALRGEVVRDRMGFQCERLDWIIVGGESGAGARPCAIEWIDDIVSQCGTAGQPVFVKQTGSRPVFVTKDNAITGWIASHGQKGGDPQRWPESLRVREFPRSSVPA
jgi:protein gp37